MKAVTIREAGPASSLKILELPIPQPKQNEVLIRQTYAGVNFGDVIRRSRGLFEVNETGCFIPGFEGTGEIASVGDEVKNFKVGEKVSYLNSQNGGYGQFVCVDQQAVYQVPLGISEEHAAVMTCVGLTAWHLVRLSNASANDFVIVHGASGGVGLIITQLCLLNKIKVIAIVGSEEKRDFLLSYRPTNIFLRGEIDLVDKIKILTKGIGVAAIFDCVGQAVLDFNINCIRKNGTILYYGSASGHSFFPGLEILMNSLNIQGFNIFNVVNNREIWLNGIIGFLKILENKEVSIYIDKIYKMEEAQKAHELLETRKSMGKLILDMR